MHKGKPFAPLLEKKHSKAGRNHHGRITVRHQGGGHKQHIRIVDFKRTKDGIPAKVERIEYDPNRSAHLALLCMQMGKKIYYCSKRVKAGEELLMGLDAPFKVGNALP